MRGRHVLLLILLGLALVAWWLLVREPLREEASSASDAGETRPPTTMRAPPAAGDAAREALDPPRPAVGADVTQPPVRLRVTALAAGDRPVAGCDVSVTHPAVHATGDARGVAELMLPPGSYWLTVMPTDPELDAVSGRLHLAAEGTDVVVTLPRRGALPLYGRVLRAAGGAVVAGARIAVHAGPDLRAEIRSAGDGTFQANLDPVGAWVQITADDAGPALVAPVPGTSPAAPLDVVLPAAADLRVRVERADGAPVAGVGVHASVAAWRVTQPTGAQVRPEPFVWNGDTDAAGEVAFRGLPAAVRVEVAAGDVTAGAVLEPGANTITLRRGGARVLGLALDAGNRPLVDVALAVGRFEPGRDAPALMPAADGLPVVRSGRDGAFEFRDLAAGTWLVGVVPGQGTADAPVVAACVTVAVAAGDAARVELHVPAPGFVGGRASLPDGSAAVGVGFVLRTAAGARVAEARSDGRGGFRLGPVPPGEWLLDTELFEDTYGLPRRQPVRTGEIDLDVRLAATTGSVRGQVVDAAGRQRAAWVSLKRRASGDEFATHADLDGHFDFRGLREGTWDGRADARSGEVALVSGIEVRPGAASGPWRFELQRTGTLLVRGHEAQAVEVRVARGETLGWSDSVGAGAMARVALPAGTWDLEVRRDGQVLRRTRVEIVAGQLASVGW